MALSELCCARIVTLRQRHSHGKARIRANIFYTTVYDQELHFGIHSSQSSPAQTLQMRPRIHGVRLSVAYSTVILAAHARRGLIKLAGLLAFIGFTQ